ncbi:MULTISPECIES: hypothetical protein [unclassified Nocardiopsis]|uniref:hypothetical protein n=1 Tax=unclassified Nocardiopsis TaxID=2649073 RepID=UPI00066CEB42|nr:MULTISPECIES: hypothetical protein [unclassified Nocardiopsis]MBQ1081220.1 hypothetical protein [Nocardiopsis sp. B62]
MSDSPQYPGGYQQPEEPEPQGGYVRPTESEQAPRRAAPRPEPRPGEHEPPVAAERFRRTTPARSKVIPVERSRGFWRLATGTVFYVMIVGGMADYVDPGLRIAAHLGFWLLIGLAFLVATARERRHDWAPRPRWPWIAAALGGAVTAEVLIVVLGSPAIIIGGVVLLALGSFFLMLVG